MKNTHLFSQSGCCITYYNILDENILAANKLLRENTGIELPLEKYQFFKNNQ